MSVHKNYLQPTTLPIETLMSSHNSNLPISENTENDAQLTQLDHPDSIDGECNAYIVLCVYFFFNSYHFKTYIYNFDYKSYQ